MSAKEIAGVALYAMALVMVGWSYLAGIECGREMTEPVARYVSLGDLGKEASWRDENGCWRQAVVRGTVL